MVRVTTERATYRDRSRRRRSCRFPRHEKNAAWRDGPSGPSSSAAVIGTVLEGPCCRGDNTVLPPPRCLVAKSLPMMFRRGACQWKEMTTPRNAAWMPHPSRRRGRSGDAGIRHRTAGRLPDHAGNGARTCGRCRRGAPHARGTDARRQPRQPARSRESRRRPCQCESPAPGAGQPRLARPQFVQWSVASHHHPPFWLRARGRHRACGWSCGRRAIPSPDRGCSCACVQAQTKARCRQGHLARCWAASRPHPPSMRSACHQ